MRRLILVVSLLLTACVQVFIHEDCIASSVCGYHSVAASLQDIAVTGADQQHFVDGRGRCLMFTGTVGYNNQVRHIRMFRFDVWVPADSPTYLHEVRIDGYRGPGSASSLESERVAYDPALGEVVAADAYLVPSPERIGIATAVTITVDAGETSGTLRLEFPDRTFAGNWHCVASQAKT